MAAEQLQLHVSQADYEALISELDGHLGELRDVLTEYNNLNNDVVSFVNEGDSNFEDLRANIAANIDAVQRAIGFTQESKDHLKNTLTQMENMSANVGTMMTTAAETAKNAIKTAIKATGLGL